MAKHKTCFLYGSFLLLIASIPGLKLIPFYEFWGLDLHNLHTFHNCPAGNAPYGVPGSVCGDILGRPIIYPPLLYWSFLWLRGLDLRTAVYLWAVFIALSLLGTGLVWLDTKTLSHRAFILGGCFVLLLLPQFPSVFSIERGTSDIAVLILWSISYFAFTRSQYLVSGFAAGVAVMYKIYPIFAFGLLFAEFFCTKKRRFGALLLVASWPVLRYWH